MTDQTSPLSVRIEPTIAALLKNVAEEQGMSVAALIEKLVVDAADDLGLLPKNDPRRALVSLIEHVREILDDDRTLAKDPDVTFAVFNRIRDSARLMKAYEAAIAPPPGMRADKRRQFVHQRIGRYIKDHLGLVSLDEVTVPRGSNALITSYTRLGR